MPDKNFTNILEILRSFRIGGYAVFDFVVSFLGVYLLAPFLSKLLGKIGIEFPKKNWLFLVLPIAIIFHLAFGQMTPMTKNFLDLSGHYLLKIIIIALLVLGFRGVRW